MKLYYLKIFILIVLKVNLISLIRITLFKKSTTISLDQSRFLVRNFMDIYILIETIYIKVYDVDVPARSPLIIDVGASLGDFSVYCSKKYPSSTIHAIEPENSSFDLLNKNLKLNKCQNVVTHQLALSKLHQKLELSINQSNYGHTNSFSMASTQSIAATSLDNFFDTKNISHCHLLKSDCEGAEYDYLLHASPQTLAKISKIVMEYHLFNSDQANNFPKLVSHLQENSFMVCYRLSPVNSHIGYLKAFRQ